MSTIVIKMISKKIVFKQKQLPLKKLNRTCFDESMQFTYALSRMRLITYAYKTLRNSLYPKPTDTPQPQRALHPFRVSGVLEHPFTRPSMMLGFILKYRIIQNNRFCARGRVQCAITFYTQNVQGSFSFIDFSKHVDSTLSCFDLNTFQIGSSSIRAKLFPSLKRFKSMNRHFKEACFSKPLEKTRRKLYSHSHIIYQ